MEKNNRILLIWFTPKQGMIINVPDGIGYHETNRSILVQVNAGPFIWENKYSKLSTINRIYNMFIWGKE